jgi:hypothetical protein
LAVKKAEAIAPAFMFFLILLLCNDHFFCIDYFVSGNQGIEINPIRAIGAIEFSACVLI